jgi:Subtilase family
MVAGFRRTVALAGVTLLIVGLLSAVLPPAWQLPTAALADPGGNGNGNGNGGSNGNGGKSGEHDSKGNGPGGNSSEHENKGKGPGDNAGTDTADAAETPGTTGPADAPDAEAGGGGRDYVPDELVVANLGDDVRHDVRSLGFVVLREQQLASLDLRITRLRVPRQMTAPAARTLLASRYPGLLVDLNAVYRPQGQLSLPPPDYPAKLIGWGDVPNACGEGIRIGLIDTAVDAEWPGLLGAHVVQRSFLADGAKIASTEHGTAIASILVGQRSASGVGLLPSAELVVASAFGADPDGIPIADVMALISGLDWLVGLRTAVINMSFAGDANAVVTLALQRVIMNHAVVVAAAGNNGPGAPPAFPANEPGVIGVTAVDSHSQPYAEANRGDYVDFAAPGVRIWTPGPVAPGSYRTGTSFAAPFVTAAVAARLTKDMTTDPERIVDSLALTTVDLGAPGRDPVFGRGLVQFANPCNQPTQ